MWPWLGFLVNMGAAGHDCTASSQTCSARGRRGGCRGWRLCGRVSPIGEAAFGGSVLEAPTCMWPCDDGVFLAAEVTFGEHTAGAPAGVANRGIVAMPVEQIWRHEVLEIVGGIQCSIEEHPDSECEPMRTHNGFLSERTKRSSRAGGEQSRPKAQLTSSGPTLCGSAA